MSKREREELLVLHSAVCDGCDERIVGVRRKCRSDECPDFDLCSSCFERDGHAHPMAEVTLSGLVSEAHQHLAELDPRGGPVIVEQKQTVAGGIEAVRARVAEMEQATGRRFKLLRGSDPDSFIAVEEDE